MIKKTLLKVIEARHCQQSDETIFTVPSLISKIWYFSGGVKYSSCVNGIPARALLIRPLMIIVN